jgi:hypothetical protein
MNIEGIAPPEAARSLLEFPMYLVSRSGTRRA